MAELESKISHEEMLELRERYSSIEPLNWNECKQLSQNPLITIGSHGMDHICCHNKQSAEELKRQMLESKREIESRLGLSCDIFSYPNGNFTDASNKILEDAGYAMGLSTKRWDVYKGSVFSVPRL